MFCVPPVPCGKTQNGTHEVPKVDIENITDISNVEDCVEEKEDSLNDEPLSSTIEINETNGKHDFTLNEISNDSGYQSKTPSTAERRKLFEPNSLKENETNESNLDDTIEDKNDSGYKPRTPTTAERRKVFEAQTVKETETEDNFDATDQVGNFERSSTQRTSIAERRKMYESRSLSVQEPSQEKSSTSPILSRRRGSFKMRKDDEITDENRKSAPVIKQQPLDSQLKKSETPAVIPTPKRTSTVFGKLLILLNKD